MKRIVFGAGAVAAGGAEWVNYTRHYAYVKMPGKETTVRVSLRDLPPVGQWSAFTLAEAVKRLQPRYLFEEEAR